MNQLELLLSYTNDNKVNSWAALGSLEITSTTRVYNKNSIYRVMFTNTPLDGYLVFCNEFYNGDILPWNDVIIENLELGYFSFHDHIVTPYFTIIMTATDFGNAGPIDPTFIPYTELLTSEVKLPEDIFKQMLSVVGVPFIPIEDLEFTEQEILDLMVKPAFDVYYKWFPIVRSEWYNNNWNSRFEIPLPKDAYGCVGVKSILGYPGGRISNPLIRYLDEGILNLGGQSTFRPGHPGGGKYANLQGYSTVLLDQTVKQSIINRHTNIHFQIVDGKIVGNSNKTGMLQIDFAYKSNDWNDIDFARRDEVIKLCKAYICKAFAEIRTNVKVNIPGLPDYNKLFDTAKELEQEVLSIWQTYTKPVAFVGNWK